uniref:PP1-binding domain-containing protein n=1 Tax=Sander lucioperca TaxID=283035 RepID=A0A8C9ZHM9_SANLU
MATVMNTASTEGDQKETMLSPSEEDSPPVFIDPSDPLKFSELTPCQFGISVQSFVPASANSKGKSRLAQIKKARRRSSVGVRGSPETNSLIRFMAQQRMKTPPTFKTPELVRGSPFLPRVASTLRQKMASFQSLMDVEESEVCDPMPRQDSNTGGCIKTRDYLSGEAQSSFTFCLFIHCVMGATKGKRLICVFAGEDDSTGTSTVKKAKKRVRFGGPLSPEFFDKNLPPSTPLQKGGTPGRAPTPGGSLQPRPVLKTPQRSESQTPQAQPDPSTPLGFGASPTLAMPRNRRMPSVGEDGEEKDGEVDNDDMIVLRLVIEPVYKMYPNANTVLPQQPEESEPGKRSTRSAAKSAAGKMKMASTATRRWSRGVDRSLYGSRAFASKNPNLSPITETLSLISRSPAQLLVQINFPDIVLSSFLPTGANHETHLNPEMANDTRAIGHITVTNALEDPSEDSVTSPNSIKESPTEDGRGPRARGRALQKRKVSVADDSLFCEETVDQTGVKTQESCEDQTTPNLQGQADQAASQQENIRPSSDSQEVGGVAGLDLAPWQADFNFEDVFRPVATRGQRSVRRSLRNKCNAEPSSTSAGLAWLPWTSPESNSEARRKTRGRRLSAAPPVQPPLPEETQDKLTSNL